MSSAPQTVNTYFCYLLRSVSIKSTGDVYIGFTNNPIRRLRQHNGLIGAGAAKTSRKRPWEMVACIYGFPSKVAALQFEWAWQFPRASRLLKTVVNQHKYPSGAAGRIAILYEMLRRPPFCHYPIHIHYTDLGHYNLYHQRAIKALHSNTLADSGVMVQKRSLQAVTDADVLPPYMDTVVGRVEDIPMFAKKIRAKKAKRLAEGKGSDAAVDDAALLDDLDDDDDVDEIHDEIDDDDDANDINVVDQDVFILEQPNSAPIRTASTQSQQTKSNGQTTSAMQRSASTTALNGSAAVNGSLLTPGQPIQCCICGEHDNEAAHSTDMITRNLHIPADTPIGDTSCLRSAVAYCYHCSAQSHMLCLTNYNALHRHNPSVLPSTLPSAQFRSADWLKRNLHTDTAMSDAPLMPTQLECVQCYKTLQWPTLVDNTFISNVPLRHRLEKLAKHKYVATREDVVNKAVEVARLKRKTKMAEYVDKHDSGKKPKAKRGKKVTPLHSSQPSHSEASIDSISDSTPHTSPVKRPKKKHASTQPTDMQLSQQSRDSIESITSIND